MQVHDLKSNISQFERLREQNRSEIRWNDRNFQPGDVVVLREWSDAKWDKVNYTGRYMVAIIRDVQIGVPGMTLGHAMVSYNIIHDTRWDEQYPPIMQAQAINTQSPE